MNRLIAFSDTPTLQWAYTALRAARSAGVGMDRIYWRCSPGDVARIMEMLIRSDTELIWVPPKAGEPLLFIGVPVIEDTAVTGDRVELRHSDPPPWWERLAWRAVACAATTGSRGLTRLDRYARSRERRLP